MRKIESPDDSAMLAGRLNSAAIHLLRRLRREDDASGLSAPLLSALSVIVFAGPLSLKALAAQEQVRPASMSRTVDGLSDQGLVVRERNPDDRRAVRLVATQKGRDLMNAGRDRRISKLASEIETLPWSARRRLTEALSVIEALAGGSAPNKGGATDSGAGD
jgi:DNA-binding MarR family transcriptional regulator